ncbi:hypothetical protein OQA88_7463 [Cercophora sp. LCS_1]
MRLSLLSSLLLLVGGGGATPPGHILQIRNTTQPSTPKNSSSTLRPLYKAYSSNTPVFQNEDLIRKLSTEDRKGVSLDSKANDPPAAGAGDGSLVSLFKRDDLPIGTCAPGIPCSNGACCSDTGVCSYAPSSCAPEVCISNCDAKAPCGEYADPESASCPLNVCCSQYGFCGSTSEFCGTGCQAGFGGCGPPPTPSCTGGSSSNKRRIGYYESWATTRPCDIVEPEDIDLTGLTHINFAFSFFHPTTFEMTPMDANAGSLYSRFTALKKNRPGLQTWIAIGGWSFNDATNVPNTQAAFSDMVSTSGNRQTFINSLINFMQTYSFDGVDLDWEYPVADDRGGKPSDFANFPIFLAELRAALGPSRGISVTLPSSFWYLQHFDVLAMEPHIDWFNMMSYDIHGVWDSTNKFTGPYIRPHTNLTEIEEGLALLWRAGVNPANVVLGLGWYGRSFTLEDPNCSVPNGLCRFTAGGAPGECSRSAGTLTNAEIKRIIDSEVGVESYDATAGVRWLKWNTNQWVSYDDGITAQQKIATANKLCLGGIMIWAIDQDNANGDSMNDLLGIGKANGVSSGSAASYRQQLADATLQQAVASSCYWSLCGGTCTTGYFGVAEARGQVAGIERNSVCLPGEVQTLCCAPGTTMGTCRWEGFRGVGFPCSPACSDPEATIVARNTNSVTMNEGGQLADLTCIGGFQAYCCSGFVPSSVTNSGNLALYGPPPPGVVARRDLQTRALEERGLPAIIGLLEALGALCASAGPLLGLLAPFTMGATALVEGLICAAAGVAAIAIGFRIIGNFLGWLFGGGTSRPNIGTPITTGPRLKYGQWPILDFGSGPAPCDCAVTYTCKYGMGWDEVCDNQRWAINKGLNGRTVFQPLPNGRAPGRSYSRWGQVDTQRHKAYRTLVQGSRDDPDARCELDEFPMGNLRESGNNSPQMCRLVHWKANNAQGGDYSAWKAAQWWPCSIYRSASCGINDQGPPATWKFNALPGNRGGGSGQKFLSAYGFDSQTPGSLCFASYTFTRVPGAIENTMITDHGFRVLDSDPMFGQAYGWPRQSYRVDPSPISNALSRPYNLQPGIFHRAGGSELNSGNETDTLTPGSENDSSMVCHADFAQQGPLTDMGLEYDNLIFVDMDGNRVDGSSCSVIYDERDDGGYSKIRFVVDADGNLVDTYMEEHSEDDVLWIEAEEASVSPITVTVEPAVVAADSARPADPITAFPASTAVTLTKRGSIVTLPPY